MRASPQQPEEDLDDAAQHQRGKNVADAVLMHHRANNQRHRACRRGDHRRASAEQGHTEAQHNGRHKAHFRVDARNDRERNHFRDQRQRGQNARQRFAHQQARCAQHMRDRKLRHRPSRSLSIRHEYLQVFYNERRPLRAAGTGDGTEQGDKTPALRTAPITQHAGKESGPEWLYGSSGPFDGARASASHTCSGTFW
ncbi:Uncharacterised protein [Cronobacter sakazakii]|nr:Uncharacterised protein [Cronobacter sakazakii]